jgi:hypothetical protein
MVKHRKVRIAAVPNADERHVDLAVREDGGLGYVKRRAATQPKKRGCACRT